VLYRLDADAAAIARRFGAFAGDDPWAGGYISPGRFAPVITAGREFIAGPGAPGQPRRMTPRLWGVPPPPKVMAKVSAKVLHGERNGVLTVRNPQSPFWISNLRNPEFRCLVPATAAMVWGKGTDHEGRRLRHWIAPTDQRLFAFAGVWKDSEIPSFALLTCKANAFLRGYGHETMPVILPPDPAVHKTWLHASWTRAQELLTPYSSSLMRETAAGMVVIPPSAP